MAHHHHHHSHPHAHHVPLAPGSSYAENNRAHYDGFAGSYDDIPGALEVTKGSSDAMIAAVDLNKENTTVLDFASGTGLISLAFVPYVKEILGIDISEGMVQIYNGKANKEGLSDKMKAICADITSEPNPIAGRQFDYVVCAHAYHHFDDIGVITEKLAQHLVPGGTLVVVDWARTEVANDVPQDYRKIVSNGGGFVESEMRAVFEKADLTNFSFERFAEVEIMGVHRVVFLAKGSNQNAKL